MNLHPSNYLPEPNDQPRRLCAICRRACGLNTGRAYVANQRGPVTFYFCADEEACGDAYVNFPRTALSN